MLAEIELGPLTKSSISCNFNTTRLTGARSPRQLYILNFDEKSLEGKWDVRSAAAGCCTRVGSYRVDGTSG